MRRAGARLGDRAAAMRLHQGRRLALVFAPLLLALLVTGYLAVRAVRAVDNIQHVMMRNQHIEVQIAELQTALNDVEIAERNLLLTGDPSYLARFPQSRASILQTVGQLQTESAAEVGLRYQSAELGPLIMQRFDQLQSTNDLWARHHGDVAVALIGSPTSGQTMNSISALLQQMDATQQRAVQSQAQAATGLWLDSPGTIVPAVSLDMVLLAALFVLIWHVLAQHERHLRAEREARAQVEAALNQRDQFLSIASHELRTPITILAHNMEFLERRVNRVLQSDDALRQSFGAIHRQLARLQALISRMLDVSRIASGQLGIEHEPLDFADLVRTVVDDARPSAPTHPIEANTPSEALMIRGDAVRLSEVVLNLLQNASKYSPDGAPIRVDLTHAADDAAVLTVADQGIGIPADVLPHLFERFYRAPSVRSEHISGMGVGLFVVHEIVALHGGAIDVSSTVGVGSSFTVRLPLLAPDEAPSATDISIRQAEQAGTKSDHVGETAAGGPPSLKSGDPA